jgi:ubiquinone/menaquinone biosynthesis C-methylase UbiE
MDIRQVANKNKYDLAASSYDLIAFLMSLGQASRLYNEVANTLEVPKGGTMVELGCGPGSVVPSILRKYGESIEIVGIDFSRKMIDLANRKKVSNGWRNVQFKCMDMYEFSPTKKADSVVFCLALTAMPDYKKAIEKAISILKPGGQLLIIDSIPLKSKWYHPISNAYIYLKSVVVGAKPVGAIVDFVNEKAARVERREMVFGVYTLIDAKRK